MKKFFLLVAILIAVLIASPACATVLLSDNFDLENSGYPTLNYNSFLNWIVTDGAVDLIGNGSFDFLPGNGLYIDLDGSTYNAGKLTSRADFSLAPGTYRLRFDLAGSQRGDGSNVVGVSLGSAYSENFSLGNYVGFTTITRDITISQSMNARLSFDHSGTDNMGMLLDRVSFEQTGGTVPEPASMVLIGLGAASMLFTNKRRSK